MKYLSEQDVKVLNTLVYEFPSQLELYAELAVSGVRLPYFSSVMETLPVIALRLVSWLDENPSELVRVARHAAQARPAAPIALRLSTLADRIDRIIVQRQISVPPWAVVHVDGVPIVNRQQLRATLEGQIARDRPKVVLVDGPSGAGRTHSVHLIRHVAERHRRQFVHINLTDMTAEELTIEGLFVRIVEDCSLTCPAPTSVGVPSQSLARRFADRLRKVIHERGTCLWLTLDGLDNDPPPPVVELVAALASLALSGMCSPLKLFLLGAGDELNLQDDYLMSDRERLSPFAHGDIAQCAHGLNMLGASPLLPDALQDRIDNLIAINADPDIRIACRGVSSGLSRLRREIEA
ncbi:AAA family ATPase [Brevundimonas sp.]|uniref:AAA family ATPase n=1 Tax=Brevundimonas sp. TaxID=1871086 RepID=UPI003D0D0807